MQEKYIFQTVLEHEKHRLPRAFVDVEWLCSRVEPQKESEKLSLIQVCVCVTLSLRSNQQPVNFKKTADLDKVQLEPAIWSRDTGQRIPCFERCQLTITLMSNIKDVCCKLQSWSKLSGQFVLFPLPPLQC